MKIVLVTAYYNHHQAPLAQELDLQTDHNFVFIETKEMEEERIDMGWLRNEVPTYVFQFYKPEMKKKCIEIINIADVVIWGSCPFGLIKPRLRKKKLTFAYSERIFKEGLQGYKYWLRAIKYYLKLNKYKDNHYLLCASAYAASDYNRIGLFENRSLKWGYFPETKVYNLARLMADKQPNTILWVGRFLPLKHPEVAILLIERLKKNGYLVKLNMIGSGKLEKELRDMVIKKQLVEEVCFLGTMSPEAVRKEMEKAALFLFTSDKNEGWGAVLNEAMNSGCIVIANTEIGSVPYLICNGENGFTYTNSNFEELYGIISKILKNVSSYSWIGENAYKTIRDKWNPRVAVKQLLEVCNGNNNGHSSNGPASIDEKMLH